MAEALKIKGVEELRAFRKRLIRQYGREAINRGDYEKALKMVDELEAHVIAMPEKIPLKVRRRMF
jgi:hypothetical protein